MNIKKAIILGIDALEYDLVEEWDLKNLKQEEYGKVELPKYPGEDPNTRIIWPCFITGRMPHEMGYVSSRVFRPPLQFFVNLFLPKIKYILSPQRDNPKDIIERRKSKRHRLSLSVYKLFTKMKLTRMPKASDIKAETIFDSIKNSVHCHVPVYDEDLPDYSKTVVKAIEDKAYRPIFEMKCIIEFNRRTKEVFEWLKRKNEWDLFMQYFWLLDGVQHAFYKNLKKIAKFYIMFDEFVGKLRKEISDDILLLIVSDHGQKRGNHTNHGFYSVNKPLGLKNPRLIDFKWIIEDLLKFI